MDTKEKKKDGEIAIWKCGKLIPVSVQSGNPDTENIEVEDPRDSTRKYMAFTHPWMGLEGWPDNFGQGAPSREIYSKGEGRNNPDSGLKEGEILPNWYDVLQILKAHQDEILRLGKELKEHRHRRGGFME